MRTRLILLFVLSVIFLSSCSQDPRTILQTQVTIDSKTLSLDETYNLQEQLRKNSTAQKLDYGNAKIVELNQSNTKIPEEFKDVKITKDPNGSIIARTKLTNNNSNSTSNARIGSWCIPNTKSEGENSFGKTNGTIVGPVIYKQKEYCKAIINTQTNGLQFESEYYFNYNKTDVWVISYVLGEKIEHHIVS